MSTGKMGSMENVTFYFLYFRHECDVLFSITKRKNMTAAEIFLPHTKGYYVHYFNKSTHFLQFCHVWALRVGYDQCQ